ncbi:hypothetical protein Lal_00002183, partial [Lupinus albus]
MPEIAKEISQAYDKWPSLFPPLHGDELDPWNWGIDQEYQVEPRISQLDRSKIKRSGGEDRRGTTSKGEAVVNEEGEGA